ncbi:hypothetical protein [Limnohabitans sp. T6-5]|nr:hypothetical protein [Limnohabitans sp. T6-5]
MPFASLCGRFGNLVVVGTPATMADTILQWFDRFPKKQASLSLA